jgi:hypothetical protein
MKSELRLAFFVKVLERKVVSPLGKIVMRFRFLVLVFLFFSITEARAQGVKFETTFRIDSCGDSICLVITTLNQSERAMYFPPWKRLLEIKDARGVELRELGPIVEFPVLELSDHKKIMKGERFEEIIDLKESYQLVKRGSYTIRVGSGYFDPENRTYHKKPIHTITFYFAGT